MPIDPKIFDDALQNFNRELVGKTIARVEWFPKEEANEYGWLNRPVVIEFTDGSYIVPFADDEGNDGGTLYFTGQTGAMHIHGCR